MIHILFGNYLKNKEILSEDVLKNIYEKQKQTRAKLGIIAVSEKMLTIEQTDRINSLQSVYNKRFGDIAVENKFLTEEQVSRLLAMQGNLYLSFVQCLVDDNVMTIEEVEEAFTSFQKELGFTRTDMDTLKSGNMDLIIPLFLPSDSLFQSEFAAKYQKRQLTICINTLFRLIDSDLYIDKASFVDKNSNDRLAIQNLDGDANMCLIIGGNKDNLLYTASTFANENFEKVDNDALDSIAELINCVNGMFASECSGKFNIDMQPPQYYDSPTIVKYTDGMCLVPVYIKGKRINIISIFDDSKNSLESLGFSLNKI